MQVALRAVGLNPQAALQNLEMLVLSGVVVRGWLVPARGIVGLDGEYVRVSSTTSSRSPAAMSNRSAMTLPFVYAPRSTLSTPQRTRRPPHRGNH
jgi:hypothetical protein